MFEAIFIAVLLIVALDQRSKAKYYEKQYQEMKRKCNDIADENHHLKIKYDLRPIFSYDTTEDDIYDT